MLDGSSECIAHLWTGTAFNLFNALVYIDHNFDFNFSFSFKNITSFPLDVRNVC